MVLSEQLLIFRHWHKPFKAPRLFPGSIKILRVFSGKESSLLPIPNNYWLSPFLLSKILIWTQQNGVANGLNSSCAYLQ